MYSHLLRKRSSAFSVSFEHDFQRFCSYQGHSAYPYISEDSWKEYQSMPTVLKRLNTKGQKEFATVQEKYSLTVNRDSSIFEDNEELRVVVVGKTGVGKSATCNSILGAKVFKDGHASSSVTSKSEKRARSVRGRTISVMDTPGLHDTHKSKENIVQEIARVMEVFSKGIHAFIYVQEMTNPRFTRENKETLQFIEDLFGTGVSRFRILIYSKADSLTTSCLDQFCEEQMRDKSQTISHFLRDLDWRIVAINNVTTVPAERKRNQEVVIAMIDKLRLQNNNAVYTYGMFQEAEKKRIEVTKRSSTVFASDLYTSWAKIQAYKKQNFRTYVDYFDLYDNDVSDCGYDGDHESDSDDENYY